MKWTFEQKLAWPKAYSAWYNVTRIRYQKGIRKWMPPQACFEASFGGHPWGASL